MLWDWGEKMGLEVEQTGSPHTTVHALGPPSADVPSETSRPFLLHMSEDRVSEPEYRSIEIIQSKEQREKKKKIEEK